MSLKRILFTACLLIASTGLYGQPLVVNGDTLYGYSPDEVRAIADKIIELESCVEESALMQDQINNYRAIIKRYEATVRTYQSEMNVLATLMESCQKQNSVLMRDNRRLQTQMKLGGGIAVVLIVLTLLYGH